MHSPQYKNIIKNVKHFFLYDYDNYLSLANEANSIKGLNFDNTAVEQSARTDSKERLYLRIMDSQKIIQSVDDAVNSCQDDAKHPYKKVLKLHFLKMKSNIYVINEIPFEKTFYYRCILPNAMVEFANKFLVKQLINEVENIIDLTAPTV